MSNQTRLNTEQAIALMEQSDEEDDWVNSEEEEDADDTYLPDLPETAELEADEAEESLLNESGSENQHTDACSQVTIAATQTNTDAQSENEDQQIDDDNTYTNTGDASQSNDSGTDDPQETSHTPATPIAPFSPPLFPYQAGPQHTLSGNASVLEYFLLVIGDIFFPVLADQTNLYAQQHPPGTSYHCVYTFAEEMMLFLGIHLAMGVHKLPSVEDYWYTHSLLGVPGVIQGMPIC